MEPVIYLFLCVLEVFADTSRQDVIGIIVIFKELNPRHIPLILLVLASLALLLGLYCCCCFRRRCCCFRRGRCCCCCCCCWVPPFWKGSSRLPIYRSWCWSLLYSLFSFNLNTNIVESLLSGRTVPELCLTGKQKQHPLLWNLASREKSEEHKHLDLQPIEKKKMLDSWEDVVVFLQCISSIAFSVCSGFQGRATWGGSHIDMVYVFVPAFWGTFSRNMIIAIEGFSSETKEPKLHKLGVFWANYCKKHPIWSKFGAFISKMVYWWVGNLAKNWYRDSQIFEVRQAHPRTILVKEPPPPGVQHETLMKHLNG